MEIIHVCGSSLCGNIFHMMIEPATRRLDRKICHAKSLPTGVRIHIDEILGCTHFPKCLSRGSLPPKEVDKAEFITLWEEQDATAIPIAALSCSCPCLGCGEEFDAYALAMHIEKEHIPDPIKIQPDLPHLL
jgi:hypothetical protein